MKRLLYISENKSDHLLQDEFSDLHEYEIILCKSFNELRFGKNNKLPDLIVCRNYTEDFRKVFQKYKALASIPVLFILPESQSEACQDLKHNHHYLVSPFSKTDLHEKIVQLLIAKSENSNKNKPIKKTGISNIKALKSYMETYGERINLNKNKIIFRENRHSSFIYIITKGLVKTSRMDQLGKELITGIYRKNELLGLYGFHKNPICPEMATTLESTICYRILHKEFREILQQNQGLSLDMAQYLTDTVLMLKSQLLEMAYASVLKKTSNTILQFADELKNPDLRGVRISRTDLASIAGIAPESFIRSLSSLKKEGIIAIKGKNINILNEERLQKIT